MATDKLVDFDHVTDYISREAAIKARGRSCDRDCAKCDFAIEGDSWCDGEVFVVDLLRIPAADVRPVVLCRDCRHRDPEDRKCDSGEMERQGCVFPVDDDYFCAYGER